MSDERLDQAIDEVARELTRGEPGGAFRAQVLARIEAGEAPRTSWRAVWIISPLVVVALITIAVFMTRPAPTRTTDVARDIPAPAAEHPAALAPAPTTVVAAQIHTAERVRPRAAGQTIAGAALQEPALDPITVAPLTIDTITPDSISLEQLDSVAPITVAPLDISDLQRRFE
jgi:hypothetical protein